MKKISLLIKIPLYLLLITAISGCGVGQVAGPTATPTSVDMFAVMTSAAGTAFVQLTQIAALPSLTSVPSKTIAPSEVVPTQDPFATEITPSSTEASSGLPVVETPIAVPGMPTNTIFPSLTPAKSFATTAPGMTCLNSKYIGDVTIPDGTVMKPYEKFQKIWRIQNTGGCNWDQGFGFKIWNGDPMNGENQYFSNNDQPIYPGGTVDMVVNMRAPTKAGDYIAHWQMVSDSGMLFGSDFTIYIKVVK